MDKMWPRHWSAGLMGALGQAVHFVPVDFSRGPNRAPTPKYFILYRTSQATCSVCVAAAAVGGVYSLQEGRYNSAGQQGYKSVEDEPVQSRDAWKRRMKVFCQPEVRDRKTLLLLVS
jgi:hypothetical protein